MKRRKFVYLIFFYNVLYDDAKHVVVLFVLRRHARRPSSGPKHDRNASSVLIKLQIGKPYTHARERLLSRRRSANRTIYDVIKLDNRQLRACAFIHSIVVNFNLKNL
ncbi:conserved hypothetical protein [Trichinella spiralis]|uniref:hypothetical protein n=1 Tax=Trichinella spiralis TaxID=6334 RepID=UPI0001EFBDBC|nr:conserved hypothetical protein [Trichinella spiralis]